ncbi:MAG: hypothetical protein H6828_15935 [Planctomycetes bacterium]|nr:hypothetical protein [Planctomycetota bacterium]MCB9916616.1 hypothetical protein [Planctomycetota bacterium]
MLDVALPDHPSLEAGLLVATFAEPLGALPVPEFLGELLRPDARAPLSSDDDVRAAVRDLLRHGGYKPTGRGKPSSEYLVRAVAEQRLPSINLAVDACNVVSLHSGLPISVVDLERVRPPLSIAHGEADASYVFNASGQQISVAGLLCLCDADGPCANAVKDSQRTKTHAGTRSTLSVIWGTRNSPGRTASALAFYAELLERAGARVETSCAG